MYRCFSVFHRRCPALFSQRYRPRVPIAVRGYRSTEEAPHSL
nr:MAG TPA: hypothetical protein [Caudoviricetes sp.]